MLELMAQNSRELSRIMECLGIDGDAIPVSGRACIQKHQLLIGKAAVNVNHDGGARLKVDRVLRSRRLTGHLEQPGSLSRNEASISARHRPGGGDSGGDPTAMCVH